MGIDLPLIGIIIALFGCFSSATAILYYIRRIESIPRENLTARDEYYYPFAAVAATGLIMCFGSMIAVATSTSDEVTYLQTIFLSLASAISCSGFFELLFIAAYLVSLYYVNLGRRK